MSDNQARFEIEFHKEPDGIVVVNQYFVHILSPVTDNCSSSISGRRNESSERDFIIGQNEHFHAEYLLQMASTLVDINRACIGQVRMLNPFPTAISIKQDAVTGKAEAIEGEPAVLAKEEASSEVANGATVKRVKLLSEDRSAPLTESTVRKTYVVDPEVPSHLDELKQKTTENLDDEQKKRVAQMLNEFQDIFLRMTGTWG